MIKVNLLRDRTQEKDAAASATGQMSYAEVLKRNRAGGPIQLGFDVHPFLKLIIMVVPLALVFSYEKYTTSVNQKAMGSLVFQLDKAKQDRERSRAEVAKIREREAELDASRVLLTEFRKIDYERLLPIRVLDSIQDILPFQAWLQTVNLTRTNINVDGVAVSENDLTQFQQNLMESQFFSNILIYNSVELRNEVGRYVSFKLRANVGEKSSGR